jgi:protein-disulfide isomerase
MMKRLLTAAAAALLPLCLSAAPTTLAALKAYAEKASPLCPEGKVTLEPLDHPGPVGFVPYVLTQTSADKMCGRQIYLLHSPASQQVLIGVVFGLPPDSRSPELRIAEAATQLMKTPVTATVSGLILPDRIREVTMTKQTAYGPFPYHAFLDASEHFLIIGTRGMLSVSPAQSLVNSIGLNAAVRRGNPKSKVEIIELSDFQCPTCGRAHKEIEPLIAKNLSKINYARLDLPLFEHHQWSLPAALGARAIQQVAPAQYWNYVNFIFGNQDTIEKTASANPQSFDKLLQNFCEDHDIEWKAVERIYRSPAERAALLEQVSLAFDNGIMSTPTYIINGRIMGYGPEGKFTIAAIKRAIGVMH